MNIGDFSNSLLCSCFTPSNFSREGFDIIGLCMNCDGGHPKHRVRHTWGWKIVIPGAETAPTMSVINSAAHLSQCLHRLRRRNPSGRAPPKVAQRSSRLHHHAAMRPFREGPLVPGPATPSCQEAYPGALSTPFPLATSRPAPPSPPNFTKAPTGHQQYTVQFSAPLTC